MYSDVGKELKFYAKLSVWICVFVVGIIGWIFGAWFAHIFPHYDEFLGTMFGMCCAFLFAFIGYAVGRLIAIWHYAYAEIVDCAVKIQEHLEKEELENAPKEPVCEKCGSRYESDAKWCSNCGAMIKANHSTITDEDKRTAMINKWKENQLISDEEIKRRMGH